MITKLRLFVFFVHCLIPMLLLGQGKPYEGPIDPAGDPAMEREGWMNGNKFRMLFNNNTQIADYPRRDASKWPNDLTGTKLLDVCALEIGAEVYIRQDSIPIQSSDSVAYYAALGQKIDTLFYIQTQDYHGWQHVMPHNWDETVEWGLAPVPGYINLASDYPAMSNRPDSWPVDGWPSTNHQTKWHGEWFGRYGRGLVSANLETYFVANDAQDMQYIIDLASGAAELLITDGPRYYPRRKSNKYIGDDARPGFAATTQIGRPWGGIGIRVELRGYQWNNPETRDIIFWEYNIANISDYDLPTTGFGYYIDPSIGGDTGGDGETSFFNKELNMSYIWEVTGIGHGGLPTGVLGLAFLESPGKPYDGEDNDNDGLLDEKRDNVDAGTLVGPTVGIYDVQKFLEYYKLDESELREHFEGDEDQDWYDGNDLNGNGTYGYYDLETGRWQVEPGENSGDDVGLDGVGPADLNYTGPDIGECDHEPSYAFGVGCEPNYNTQDINEADQIGLTSHTMMTLGEWGPYKSDQDKNIWNLMNSGELDEDFLEGNYIMQFFSSATFPLYRNQVERISIAMIAAYDDLTELNAGPDHEAERLFKKKANAQVIYERDYRFAQPPTKPTLKAYPGNGKVILTWDDAADKYTVEPLLGRVNDFEGYKLYRSTDIYFQDAEYITNAQGIKSFRKPIFQCDKIDTLEGYSTIGIHEVGREGTAFYLGDNSGISHSYIDEDVQNGRTYYYYLAAYDYGIEEFGISPTENLPDYDIDADTEQIIRLGTNMQVVMPRSDAAGYIPPYVKVDENQSSPSIGETEIIPEIVAPEAVKANHKYRVTFGIDTMGFHWKPSANTYHSMGYMTSTNSLYVYDISDNDNLVYSETFERNPRNNIVNVLGSWEFGNSEVDYTVFAGQGLYSDVFDGIRMNFNLTPLDTVWLDHDNSGWQTGNSDMIIETGKFTKFYAWDYDIIFTDTVSTNGTKSSWFQDFRDLNGTFLAPGVYIQDHQYNFYVVNRNSLDSSSNPEKMDLFVHDLDGSGAYEWDRDKIYVSHVAFGSPFNHWVASVFAIDFTNVTDQSGLPQPGDVYQIRFNRPKSGRDSLVFHIEPEVKVDKNNLKTDMDRIKVVPNPYIATNTMEAAVSNEFLNQGRRIMFTNLPAQCVIRIFTPSGILVDKINVSNSAGNGMAHWDLLTKEDLEIAAGMYIYQVEDTRTGKSKIGKFAVIK